MGKFRDMCSKVNEVSKLLRMREGWIPLWCVAWSSLYRAKYVTRLELVERKFSK